MWVYTSWITNWLNPEKTPVRLLLFALTLGGLVLSTSIPKAFDDRGLWFALAYAAMQVGKTVFLWVATPPSRPLARMNAIRITSWLALSAVFWIAGGFAKGESRLVLWGIALVHRISFAGGAVLDTPVRRVFGRGLGGRGRPHGRTLRLVHHHRARRIHRRDRRDLCRTDLDHAKTSLAFVSAFVGTLAMWWIYFHKGAEAGSEADFKIERAGQAGAARLHLSAHADRGRHHRHGRGR